MNVRLLAGVALGGSLLAGSLLAGSLLAGPAAADPGDPGDPGNQPSATSLAGTAQPNLGAAGETVRVAGTGWPAGTQVQAVVCGDLAIGGSSTCAQRSAVLGYVNDAGAVQLDLVVSAPPKPCPCVIRLSSYNGPAVAVDIPFVVTGHPVGTPPDPELPSALVTVTEVELEGDAGVWSWFGAAATKELVITVKNDGDAVALDPEVAVGVGKAEDVEPQPVELEELSLDPGETETVRVDVTLPFAAFGDYRVAGRVGPAEGGTFTTAWSAYPWGLVALNVVGALLLAYGIRRRLDSRRRRRRSHQAGVVGVTLGATPGLERPYVLPDVVYVSEVGGFLVSPRMAGRSGLLKRVSGRLEVQDLAALGAVTVAGTPMLSLPAADAPAADEAVVDLTALEAHLAARRTEPEGRQTPVQREDAVVDLQAVDAWLGREGEGSRR